GGDAVGGLGPVRGGARGLVRLSAGEGSRRALAVGRGRRRRRGGAPGALDPRVPSEDPGAPGCEPLPPTPSPRRRGGAGQCRRGGEVGGRAGVSLCSSSPPRGG